MLKRTIRLDLSLNLRALDTADGLTRRRCDVLKTAFN